MARQDKNRWAYQITNWFIREGRWDDEISRFIGNNLYLGVAYDRREWTRLREAFALKENCINKSDVL